MSVEYKTTVTISFNGQDQEFTYQPHEQVQAVLERTMNAFQVSANRHLMALFTQAGAELSLNESMEAVGVKSGDVLYLRPSTVRGG